MRDRVIAGVVIADKMQRVRDIVTTIPALSRALLFQPSATCCFYTDDGAALQLSRSLSRRGRGFSPMDRRLSRSPSPDHEALPRVREIEIWTRIDSRGPLPWARVE